MEAGGGAPLAAPGARLAPRGLSGLLSKDHVVPYQKLDTASLSPNFVLVNVYDVGDTEIIQKINRMSTMSDSVLIGGIYHAGVEVFGTEWSYGFTEDEGSGISSVPPRCSVQHTYRATCPMGPTKLSKAEVEAAMSQLKDKWRGPDYSLIHRNCLDFANALCAELGVGRIPGWIDRFGWTASRLDGFRTQLGSGVGQAARLEAPRVAVAAQTLGANMGRWGRGLLDTAARVLGDDRAGRGRRGDFALRSSLRNRGGICGAAAACQDRDDAFLLDEIPLPPQRDKEDRDGASSLDDLLLPHKEDQEAPESATQAEPADEASQDELWPDSEWTLLEVEPR